MNLELTDKERALLRNTREQFVLQGAYLIPQLLSIIHKLQAGKMKAEFAVDHGDCHEFIDGHWECLDGLTDPRHTWTVEQWLEAAKDELIMEHKR